MKRSELVIRAADELKRRNKPKLARAVQKMAVGYRPRKKSRPAAADAIEALTPLLKRIGLKHGTMGAGHTYTKEKGADKSDVKKAMDALKKVGFYGEHLNESDTIWNWEFTKLRGFIATIELYEDAALVVRVIDT